MLAPTPSQSSDEAADIDGPEVPEPVRLETATFMTGLFIRYGAKIPSEIMAILLKNEAFIDVLLPELHHSVILFGQALSQKDPKLPKPRPPPNYPTTAFGVAGSLNLIPNIWLDIILTLNRWTLLSCLLSVLFCVTLAGVEAMGLLLLADAGENKNMSPDKARYVEMAAGIMMVLHKLLLKRVFSVEKVSLDSLRQSSEHRRKDLRNGAGSTRRKIER